MKFFILTNALENPYRRIAEFFPGRKLEFPMGFFDRQFTEGGTLCTICKEYGLAITNADSHHVTLCFYDQRKYSSRIVQVRASALDLIVHEQQ